MRHSDSIAKLAPALITARAEIKAVAKDATNPHFRSRYASLDAIIDAVAYPLAKHGLTVVQGAEGPIMDETGALAGFSVETMLIHTSGEWVSNAAIMPLSKSDAQGAGGALTYGRRYGLSALLSLATDEDDDGNSASQPRASTPAKAASQPASNGANPGDKTMPFGKTKGKKLSDHTTGELEKTLAWCREKDAEKFKDLIDAVGAVLADRALGSE